MNTYSVKLLYYPFKVSLDRCNGDTLNGRRLCVSSCKENNRNDNRNKFVDYLLQNVMRNHNKIIKSVDVNITSH